MAVLVAEFEGLTRPELPLTAWSSGLGPDFDEPCVTVLLPLVIGPEAPRPPPVSVASYPAVG